MATKGPITSNKTARKPVVNATPAATAPVAPTAVAPVIEAAEAAITPAAEALAATAKKEETIMASKFEMPTFETPQMFTDINDRAKAAMEKGGKLVQDVAEFNKGNLEAIVESSRITAKGFEALGRDAAEYGRTSFEGLTATLKSLATVKSPTEFMKLQGDYLRTSFDAAVAQGSKSTEAMIKLAGDAAQPLSNRFAVAAEKVKQAA